MIRQGVDFWRTPSGDRLSSVGRLHQYPARDAYELFKCQRKLTRATRNGNGAARKRCCKRSWISTPSVSPPFAASHDAIGHSCETALAATLQGRSIRSGSMRSGCPAASISHRPGSVKNGSSVPGRRSACQRSARALHCRRRSRPLWVPPSPALSSRPCAGQRKKMQRGTRAL
jgi:hypothetical protein